jgi:CCR4-NOT transcription complex subunit 9
VRGRLRRSALPLPLHAICPKLPKWTPADGPPTRFGATAAHIPLFLYPFLNTVSKTRPFEYLRLTSLGVIGALVKVRPASRLAGLRASLACAAGTPHACTRASCAAHRRAQPALTQRPHTHHQVDDTDVINFLLSTEIIPLCLRTMELGSELSKTVATFIVQKILLDDVRLNALLRERCSARC